MELQANIIQDDCKCIIKNDEPIITLAKERRGSWCSLLKQRVSWNELWLVLTTGVCFIFSLNVNCYIEQNPNVAFDFDHWEECEEESHFSKGKMGVPSRRKWWVPSGTAHTHSADFRNVVLWKWVIQGKPLWISFLLDLSVLVWGGIDSYRCKHTSL